MTNNLAAVHLGARSKRRGGLKDASGRSDNEALNGLETLALNFRSIWGMGG